MMATQTSKKVEIDFMFLDLDICTRCKGTDQNLEIALQAVRSVLESAGVEVFVRKTLVDTEDKARRLGFVSSPTIRVNGRDIALELRESSCKSWGEACGCDGEIDCRVWLYQGNEYSVAPVPMIVDAILAMVYGTEEKMPEAPSTGGSVPANLKRFFAAKAAKANTSCCGADEMAACCEAAQKSTCCTSVEETAQPAVCGCR